MPASNALYAAVLESNEYVFDNGFQHWLEGLRNYQRMREAGYLGGYKMHLSAHPDDAEAIASLALPLLRGLGVYHKIVPSPQRYALMNSSPQKGKFITIYSGPSLDTFTRVLAKLEAALVTSRTRPGPRPALRVGSGLESKIGTTGHLSYFVIDDFER
jgi:hypothetical protein